jgi:hypothetical protein
MACDNCKRLEADYITLSARFDRVLAERNEWKAKYDNLYKLLKEAEARADTPEPEEEP